MAKPWINKSLELPIGDTTYSIAPLNYDDGLALLGVSSGENRKITPKSKDEKLFELCMGDVWQQMKADRVPYPAMYRAGMAAIQYQTALVGGIDTESAIVMAEAVWESDVDPEAIAAVLTAAANDPETRIRPTLPAFEKPDPAKPRSRTSSTSSPSSASARGTRSRASTRTTKSQPATRRTTSSAKTAKAKASRSRGTSSPRSGT